MSSLIDMVDEELEAAGYPRLAPSPPAARPIAKLAAEAVPAPPPRKPVGSWREQLKVAQDALAARRLGLGSVDEVYCQVGTRSDRVNRFKLAGVLETLLRWAPESVALPIVRGASRVQKGLTGASALGDDLEAYFMGRALRSAGQRGDVEAARALFEGAGGVPTIDPLLLAQLQQKARAFDQFDPAGTYLSGMRAGSGGGFVGGLGLGLLAPSALRYLEEGQRRERRA